MYIFLCELIYLFICVSAAMQPEFPKVAAASPLPIVTSAVVTTPSVVVAISSEVLPPKYQSPNLLGKNLKSPLLG